MLLPKDIYVSSVLAKTLDDLGDYVYGYYRPREAEPFYVGKGQGQRVLSHWREAVAGNDKHRQYVEIKKILDSGHIPVVKILAYRLRETKSEEIYGMIEAVLQNTFGIEHHLDENVFRARIKSSATLVQDRDDSRNHPVLSLDAVYCKNSFETSEIVTLEQLCEKCEAPLLLVGLSRSYHPNHSQYDLCEMARMYWELDRLTAFPKLSASDTAVLAGWVSKFGGPQIVGVWRIKRESFKKRETGATRYFCEVEHDSDLHKTILGIRLIGEGKKYQGPRICLPH